MKLYELTGKYLELQKAADDPDMPEEALRDTLEALEGDIEVKATNLLQVTRGIEGDIAAIDAEIQRLQAIKKARQNRIDSLRSYLKYNMQASGISKISCPLFTITLAKGRPMAVVDDVDKLPDDMKKVTVAPDKSAILAALKEGREVPGAHLAETDESLRIR